MLPLNHSSAGAPARRFGSIASCSALAVFAVGVYGACAGSSTGSPPVTSNEAGATTSSGSSSGGVEEAGTTSSSGVTDTTSSSGTTSGSTSGTSSGGTVTCSPPGANSATLPFAVDSNPGFVASGYEGDYNQIKELPDKTCGGDRATMSGMLGNCHTFTYDFGGDAGASTSGFAGVVWQSPANNWGAQPGFLIPAGATKISFWVRGATGTEMVSFGAGGSFGGIPTATAPCVDSINGMAATMTLPATWTQVTMPLTGATTPVTYSGGVIGAFSWAAAGGATQGATATSITFYIDDIEWQM